MFKKGFTLIELIFSMVIIALVFTVIPKIIYAFNKSDTFSIREDALFNGVSLTNMISRLPWDENNTEYNDILLTKSTNTKFACNSKTGYRIGGFFGSRNCENNLSASLISNDGESNPAFFNDFDDFNGTNTSAIMDGEKLYTLESRVFYVKDDNIFNYIDSNGSVVINLSKLQPSTHSTNLKELNLTVYYSGKRGNIRKISNFSYISANIGQIYINKRSW